MKHEIDVRAAARRLSNDALDQLYAESFNQIFEVQTFTRSISTVAFSWLLCMQEAMSPNAFLTAITMSDPQHQANLTLSELLEICSNLIVIDSKLNTLRFAHVTVQEFLETRADFAKPQANRRAAMSCLNMCMQGFPVTMVNNKVRPTEHFHHYAALYWAEHCRNADVLHENDKVVQTMKEFVFNGTETNFLFSCWINDIKQSSASLVYYHPLKKALCAVESASGTPFFTVCAFGLTKLLEIFEAQEGFDWNQKNSFGQTGLYLGSVFGYDSIVQTLLRYGVNSSITGGKYTYPLHAACFVGHSTVATCLLEHGADPHLQGAFESALDASFSGDCEEMALILLDKHVDISGQESYDSILNRASEAGFTSFIDLLIKKFPSYGHDVPSHSKAIETAIVKGRKAVLERFLQGSTASTRNLPNDAISLAALGGQDSMICFLLDSGHDINQEGRFGTPLRAASLMGHESTVRILIDKGAELNMSGSFGSALQASAVKGHASITRILIQAGADVNVRGGFYGNALQAASYRGHQTVVESLLNAGADKYRGDAYKAAIAGGHEQIGRLLFKDYNPLGPVLAYGCFRKSPNEQAVVRILGSRRFFSILCGREIFESEAFQLCQKKGYLGRCSLYSDMEEQDNYVLEAAAAAASESTEGFVRIFLACLDQKWPHRAHIHCALQEASMHGYIKIVKLLLDSKLDLAPFLDVAQEVSATYGHLDILKILLTYENQRIGSPHMSREDAQPSAVFRRVRTMQTVDSVGYSRFSRVSQNQYCSFSYAPEAILLIRSRKILTSFMARRQNSC